MGMGNLNVKAKNRLRKIILPKFAQDTAAEAAKLGITLPANFVELTNLQVYSGQQNWDKNNTIQNGTYVVDLYAKDPKAWLSNAVRNAAYNYGRMAYGAGPNDGSYLTAKNNFNIAVTAAAQGGVPIPQIQSAAQAGSSAFSDWLGGPDPLTQVGAIAMPIAMAFALPGIGQSIGANLLSSGVLAAGTSTATATAIGTAMASIAVQAGQGVPLEDAIKNAGVNAIVQSGSVSAATKLNEIIKNPAVTDALVSAGGSAVKTIAAGGSAEDIKKNIVGAVAGSATASATDSRLAGSVVGGGVSGGVTGALSSAAGELSAQEQAKQSALEAGKGTQLASADTGIVSDAGTLEPIVVTAKPLDLQDTSIISPDVSTKIPTPSVPSTPSVDQQILDLIKTTPTQPTPTQPASTTETPSAKTDEGTLPEIVVTATKPGDTLQDTNIITPDTTTTPSKDTKTTSSVPVISPETIATPAEEPAAEEKKAEEATPTDKYKPSLFLYGGTSKSTLPQTLGTGATYATSVGTTGLTGERGAGEIESKETGKKRKNVWNEASLRLKDALGV